MDSRPYGWVFRPASGSGESSKPARADEALGRGGHCVDPLLHLTWVGVDDRNRDPPPLSGRPHYLGASRQQVLPDAARRLVDEAPDRRIDDLLQQPLEPWAVESPDRVLVSNRRAQEPEHQGHALDLVQYRPHPA